MEHCSHCVNGQHGLSLVKKLIVRMSDAASITQRVERINNAGECAKDFVDLLRRRIRRNGERRMMFAETLKAP